MQVRKFSIAVAAAAAMMMPSAFAQKDAPAPAAKDAQVSASVPAGGVPEFVRPETPEKRRERLGTAEDPGMDPDPSKHYWRYGKSYHIAKFERRLAVYDPADPNLVRPLGMVNFTYEIYQQNHDYVWCWMADPEDAVAAQANADKPLPTKFRPQDIEYLTRVRSEYAERAPVESTKTIKFVDSSEGLPQVGSWRNSLAVADMNEDGFPDIIAPPARKGEIAPVIFLGDGKGHWHEWTTVKWPHGLDYGGVVAADFNRDGHMDLAFAVHLNGIYVFLGDGKGNFTESSEGLPRGDFPTRRVVAVDLNGDGYPDLAAISEGPTVNEGKQVITSGLRGYLNRNKGKAWERIDITGPGVYVAGDWLSVGHLNGDRYPDLIASSTYFGGSQIAQLSDGPQKWKTYAANGLVLPSLSYYLASAIGKFDHKKEDAVIAYTRFWPEELDPRILARPPAVELTSVDRLVFDKDGAHRTPIISWAGHAGVHGMATGDFDGDGNLDLIATREEPGGREVVILLGDGKGGFTRARVEGLKLEDNNVYDIKVADVNGDGLPDVILMYEDMDVRREDFRRMSVGRKPGSIKVFLNRGAKRAAPDLKVAK